MSKRLLSVEPLKVIGYLLKWTWLLIPVSLGIGAMVALFLWLLHMAIDFRFEHPWLLYFLPLAGLLIHTVYATAGKSSEKGNNLVIDEIHSPGAGLPPEMGPLVLISTVITHLFGGSAGREGTAVQIGGSLASWFSRAIRLMESDQRTIVTAGVAAGFGAVFGTPLAGAIFAIEVLTLGRLQYNALIPCLIASVLGDLTVAGLGVHHTKYHIDFSSLSLYSGSGLLLLVKVIVAAAFFGLASSLFSKAAHAVKYYFNAFFSIKWFIPLAGGMLIIALTCVLGRPDYLSLGVDPQYPEAITIQSAFLEGGASYMSWFWKLIYTVITLGSGFKGGEVTPLFYIGATLGNSLAEFLNAPVGLFAALGFISVFSGATNTPFACTIMGVELFGGEHVIYFAVACFIAFLFSGNSGIYSAQRVRFSKSDLLKESFAKVSGYVKRSS